MLSRKHRICVGIELAVPLEHNIEKWHQSKLAKYENEIRIEAERNNWQFHTCILEVGARGWIPPSLVSALNKLGLPAVSALSNRLSLLALKSSYIIWLNRFNRDFSPWRLTVKRSSLMLSTSKTDAGAAPRTRLDSPPNSKELAHAGPTKGKRKVTNEKFAPFVPAQTETRELN